MHSDKYDAIVVGAGLSGVVIANQLSKMGHAVLLLEKGEVSAPYADEEFYVYNKSNLLFTRGMGVGGTTNYWHSGFLRISDEVKWVKNVLGDKWYLRAKQYLGIPDSACNKADEIYYPNKRYITKPIELVKVIVGVQDLQIDSKNKMVIFNRKNAVNFASYQRLVICAGGIGTPLLFLSQADDFNSKSDLIGENFADHISFAALKIKLKKISLKKFSEKCENGVVKKGIRITDDLLGLDHIFFPRLTLGLGCPEHTQILRRELIGFFGSKNYLKLFVSLLTNIDLLLEALLYKCSIRLPCRYIQFNVVSEQKEFNSNSIRINSQGNPEINWRVDIDEISAINNATDKLIDLLKKEIEVSKKFELTASNYTICCHHSGTMRMVTNGDEGLVDSNCALIGHEDIFVCDGSVLPKTSCTNTGLTIVALALRLADHLDNSLDRLPHERT